MQAALTHNIDGIVGECGGSAMCATCHVYVDESFLDKLELMSEVEDELLESTASPRLPNSRLGCQISLVDALDGLVVKVPERQS
jgi:2Fe-2S ferredoxin